MNTNLKAALLSLLIAGSAFAASALLSGCATMIAPDQPHYVWTVPAGGSLAKLQADWKTCDQLGDNLDPRIGGDARVYSQRCMLLRGYSYEVEKATQ